MAARRDFERYYLFSNKNEGVMAEDVSKSIARTPEAAKRPEPATMVTELLESGTGRKNPVAKSPKNKGQEQVVEEK